MFCSTYPRASRPINPLAATDLNAMLAPLNRYGPSALSAVLAEGLIALTAPTRESRKPIERASERSRLSLAAR